MNKKKKICYIVFMMLTLLLAFTGAEYERRQELQRSLAQKVVRFHVIANSDSSKDQSLKLAVRDAIGKYMAKLLKDAESKEQCERILAAHAKEIEKTAKSVVCEAGYDYPVTARLCETDFPVKSYGDYTFPAGRYEALELVIGKGGGHNWWCVMYPNMCFANSVYEVVDDDAKESLREVLSKEEYEEILTSGNYEIQFKYLTFLNGLCAQDEE